MPVAGGMLGRFPERVNPEADGRFVRAVADRESRVGARRRPRYTDAARVRQLRTSSNKPRPASAAMLPAERRRLILDAVVNGHSAGVVELASRFAVSEMTVRRDLAQLAREGKLTRVRGGAMRVQDEPPFTQIAVERLPEKERIGRAAAALVADGQTVMVDVGTTTLQLARHLHGRRVTVITSNLAVVDELLPDPAIELVVLGGIVRRNYRSLVGMLAEDALRQLAADVAFLGASGIREDLAVMDSTIVEVPIKRAMMAAAERTVLLVDAAKFGMRGSVRVCGPDRLDAVVTDAPAAHPGVDALVQAGVELVHA